MAEYRSSGKELRKSPKGLIAGILVFAMVIAAAAVCRFVLRGLVPLETEGTDSNEVIIPGQTSTTEDPNRVMYENKNIYLQDVGRGPLVMVSEEFPISDVEYGLVTAAEEKNDLLTAADNNLRIQKQLMDALNLMSERFQAETGLQDLLIAQGWRGYEQQRMLYEGDLQKTGRNTSDLYAVPGACELESGYSAQIDLYQNGRISAFDAEDDHAWILAHCAEYGIIQRYPTDKEDITKVRDQANIFRYVGVPHAMYITKHDLTLEEYIMLVETYPFEGDHLLLSDNLGREYEAYYVPADFSGDSETVSVPLPSNLHYAVSGTNKYGFIVTVELGEPTTRETAVETLPPRTTAPAAPETEAAPE